MKKLIAMLLAAVMVMGVFAACSVNVNTEATTEATTESVPAESATEILENIWAQMGEENQFFVMGGNMENVVDGKPGEYNMEYKENLTYNLLVPENELANIDEAGFVQHAMNANNFTAGVVHYTGDVTAFAAAMQSAIQNNQWICGFPEALVIAVINTEYVLVTFGINDAMNPFITALDAAYANADVLYNEAIGG